MDIFKIFPIISVKVCDVKHGDTRASSFEANLFLAIDFFRFGNRIKSLGTRSCEYVRWETIWWWNGFRFLLSRFVRKSPLLRLLFGLRYVVVSPKVSSTVAKCMKTSLVTHCTERKFRVKYGQLRSSEMPVISFSFNLHRLTRHHESFQPFHHW